MKLLERFLKYLPKCPDKFFIADMQLDRETDLNIIAQFHNFEGYYKYVSKGEIVCEMAVYLHAEERKPH